MAIEEMKKTRHPGVFRLPDGRLLAKCSVRTPNGKVLVRKRVMHEGATEIEALNAVEELKEAARNPQPETPTPRPRDTSQTVEQYCVRWLELRAQRLSPSTAATYAWCINDRILPRLGWLPCVEVTRQIIEAWVIWAEAQRQAATRKVTQNGKTKKFANPTAGKRYAQDTMRQWWRCLCTILGDMSADLDLPDPTRRVRPPERPDMAPVREQGTLNADNTGDLLAAAKAKYPQHYASIAVMAMTGMRAGEVFALKWDVVDFGAATIAVKRAVSRNKLLERTKTKQQRIVPMHPELAQILLEHRNMMLQKQHVGLHTNLLFPSIHGKLRLPSSLKKVWTTLRKLTDGTISVGSQVLRRSLNTQFVLAGVDRITTRAILGHTSEAMTQRYAGIGLEAKADAVLKLGSKLKLAEPAGE